MKKLFFCLVLLCGTAQAQLVQQIGNQVYVTDQRGMVGRIEFSGNNAYVHTTPRYEADLPSQYTSGPTTSYQSSIPAFGSGSYAGSAGISAGEPGILDWLIGAPLIYVGQALALPFIALDLLTEKRPYEVKCDQGGCHKEIISQTAP